MQGKFNKGDEVELKIFEGVYEPAEDSFLLMKHAIKCKGRVLEIGCGSGIIAISNKLHNPENYVVAADVDKKAVENTKINAKLNNIEVKVIQSDLFQNIKEKFDWVLFNPPYLPCPKEEDPTICGGKKDEIIITFLTQARFFLLPHGKLLFILSSKNNLKGIEKKMEEENMEWEIVDTKSLFFETLYVIKARYKHSPSSQQ